ncbi:MAG: PAS domain-containing sensor histidine kinase, partial [Ignavibacteriae bacterium]|nr:PAS domain-containing sensor histidine kinase [Ignavibacteriota bacterium]
LNSIYIMNNGGSLIITTKTAKLKFIELIIEDTGKGLTKEELKNLFDPFYTNREGGTGLGLAITYSIIMEHSGTVQALNRKTKGAKFIIKLPIK